MTAANLRALLARYPELAAVLAAAVIGLSVQRPLAWLAARQGINVLLAVLVFATAVTIEPAALRRAAHAWRPVLAVLAVGVTALPALAWAAARIVAAGPLRDGVLTVGLAPCEIASVATTAMAGGEAAVAAGLLIGSTIAAVAIAAPLLALEAGHAGFSPAGVITNLTLVVALPLATGIALRAAAEPPAGVPKERSLRTPPPVGAPEERSLRAPAALPASIHEERSLRAPASPPAGVSAERAPARTALRAWVSGATRPLATPRAQRAASHVALAAVAALVALIAAEVHLSAGYAAVAAALVVFLLLSAVIGRLLGLRTPPPTAAALLLTTSMRDFAIAAGLAAAAFGPAAAAPLGLYGILVLVWGTAAAGTLRHRAAAAECQHRALPSGSACNHTS
jgi:predicted Na+-dependent transporter